MRRAIGLLVIVIVGAATAAHSQNAQPPATLAARAELYQSIAAIESVADKIEARLQDRPEKEMGTDEVGAIVMEELKRLDKVAYVRFASVYRSFRDVGEFMSELKDLLSAKD